MLNRRSDLAPVYFFGTTLILVVVAAVFTSGDLLLVREKGAEPAACFSYLGHCAEVWTALGTMGLFIATIILVAVGLYQAIEIRAEAKLDRTLSAAERYFYDPVVDVSQRNLRDYQRVWGNPETYRIDLQVVLSQLDGLAYGTELLIYDEDYIRESMQSVFAYHVVMHMDQAVVDRFRLNTSDFPALLRLDRTWRAYPSYNAFKAQAEEFVLRLRAKGEWAVRPPTEGATT